MTQYNDTRDLHVKTISQLNDAIWLIRWIGQEVESGISREEGILKERKAIKNLQKLIVNLEVYNKRYFAE